MATGTLAGAVAGTAAISLDDLAAAVAGTAVIVTDTFAAPVTAKICDAKICEGPGSIPDHSKRATECPGVGVCRPNEVGAG